MSRREIIKKIGLGTMAALSIVAAITAPSAVLAAASFCNIGTNCTCMDSSAGMGNPCVETGTACIMFTSGAMNCRCVQTSNGNTMGTCQFV